jgi:hypothetical protein
MATQPARDVRDRSTTRRSRTMDRAGEAAGGVQRRHRAPRQARRPARPGPLADRAALAPRHPPVSRPLRRGDRGRARQATPEKSRAIINMTRPKTKAWSRASATCCSRPTTRTGASARRRFPSSPRRRSSRRRRPRPSTSSRADGRHPQPRPAAGTETMPPGAPLAARRADLGAAGARPRAGRAGGPRRDGRRQALRREHGARDRRPADRVPTTRSTRAARSTTSASSAPG